MSVSCTVEKNENNNENNKQEEKEVIDLDGYQCIIGQTNTSDEYFLQYKLDSQYDDILNKRIDDIQKNYNCQISVNSIGTSADSASILVGKIMAGESLGEVSLLTDIDVHFSFAENDGYLDLAEVNDILHYEDEEKWGSVLVREIGMIGGKQYTLAPYAWPDHVPSTTAAIAVNENLIQKFGFEDPREMLENKTWTWDTFTTLLEKYTFQDGENKYYGTCSSAWSQILPRMAILSNGVRITYVDETGKVCTDLNSELGIQSFEWAFDLKNKYSDCFYGGKVTYGNNWGDYLVPFINNECFTTIIHAYAAVGDIANNCDNYALLPFPVGPNGSFDVFPTNIESATCFGIFESAENHEGAAHVLSALCEPFEEFPTRESILDNYVRYYFFDQRDADIFMKLADNPKFSYWPVGGDTFWVNMANAMNSKTAKEAVDTYLPAYMEIMDKYIAPNEAFIQEQLALKDTENK
jgi:ABC-type glycerol-3-phosphate transport system substrate-binding protein